MLALAWLSCLAFEPSGVALGPGEARTVVIANAEEDAPVASVQIRPQAGTTVALPPGQYSLREVEGDAASQLFTVRDGETTQLVLSGQVASSASTPPSDQASPTARLESRRVARETPSGPSASSEPHSWRRWGAPLLSAVLPGLGQAVNRQPGKAAGAFGGTFGLLAGAALTRPDGGAGSRGVLEPGILPRGDTPALAGFGVLVHVAAALYVAQVLDAHAVARGRPVEAHREARVRVQLGRSTTLAMAPGAENVALYADTSAAVLARVSRRVSVGVADFGFKLASPTDSQARSRSAAFHGGVRAMVRILDTRPRWMSRAGRPSRLWLLAGGGATVQATVRTDDQPGLRPESPARQNTADQTAVVLYALGEAHYFLLDRWSLALAPRLSVPLATRHYTGGRALPRYAPAFELGLSLGVWL